MTTRKTEAADGDLRASTPTPASAPQDGDDLAAALHAATNAAATSDPGTALMDASRALYAAVDEATRSLNAILHALEDSLATTRRRIDALNAARVQAAVLTVVTSDLAEVDAE